MCDCIVFVEAKGGKFRKAPFQHQNQNTHTRARGNGQKVVSQHGEDRGIVTRRLLVATKSLKVYPVQLFNL